MSNRTAVLAGEEIDRLGAGGQERIDARGIEGCCRPRGADRSAPDPDSSTMPQARASEVPGIHSQPPDRAVVPPKRGSFSTIEHLEAVMSGGDRRRQPGRSRSRPPGHRIRKSRLNDWSRLLARGLPRICFWAA